MNLMCLNTSCKHYYEDSCMKCLGGERIELDYHGKCTTFELGKNEVYEVKDDQQ